MKKIIKRKLNCINNLEYVNTPLVKFKIFNAHSFMTLIPNINQLSNKKD